MNLSFNLAGALPVHRLGYGAMRLTGQPGNFGPYADWAGGRALLRRAIELGVSFIDTAQAYGNGWNERLIAEALHPYPAGLVIATKGGINKSSPTSVVADGRPAKLRADVESSLRELRLEQLTLWQWHRPDPQVPIEESLGEIARLCDEGKIEHIGLSNVTAEQIEIARRHFPIVSVQNRYHLRERQSEDVLRYCEAQGIAFLPHGPLAAAPMSPGAPLSTGDAALERVAARHGATSAQVALAWSLRHSPNIIAIPGTTSIAHLEENVAAASLALTDEDMAALAASENGL